MKHCFAPSTAELFCQLAGIVYQPAARPKICAPTHEIYLPRDNQGVRRMAFGWGGGSGTFAWIEFADYDGGGFWGGLPVNNCVQL